MIRRQTAGLRDQVAVSPGEAATLLSLDRATFYRHVMPLVEAGKIGSLRVGRARRILVSSLLAWAEQEAQKGA